MWAVIIFYIHTKKHAVNNRITQFHRYSIEPRDVFGNYFETAFRVNLSHILFNVRRRKVVNRR